MPELSKEMYPDVDEVVHRDIYVDDYLFGKSYRNQAQERADELKIVLNYG